MLTSKNYLAILFCRVVALVLCMSMALTLLTGCGGGGGAVPLPVCVQVGGVWNVALDYGNGLVGHQTWTITQALCTISMTGEPSDVTGPSLPDVPVTGSAYPGGFSANWSKTDGTCIINSSLDAKTSDNTFSGSIYWSRVPHGVGYCPSAGGTIAVSGTK
jgi:hypothetical protein